jgi:hypothetical protein
LNSLNGPLNLEGKKPNLEGTWRAVVGHLEGKGESLQTLIQSEFIGDIVLTWRVFGKSIYKGKTVSSQKSGVKSRKTNNSNELQKNKYRYDTAFFFNCKAVHMHTNTEVKHER